jgi:DNA-binding GntR family transcriptional regulator
VVGIFVGIFVYNHYFYYAIVDGPQERALVAAIRARDVDAARAAIAAGLLLPKRCLSGKIHSKIAAEECGNSIRLYG